ncbi:MAG TPA: putative DNA modification/repair radical SAM protein [Oligoflexus sp.]|uniref:putative DNA modification/repair radical SAM protein n=1 Tax=Oligoflexus sp. TaxID=1971216 RepID=UPI002D7EBBD2|nr:putative DNA modification/repair radical SAM protein [Oligoflexus sp.]HET9239502.1 putative DNA modification/repair radical SAM protein [Oligoflexus sp.]
MEIRSKLSILADAAKYDASCSSSGIQRKNVPGGLGNSEGMGICHSYTPDGRCISLLKVLLTNFCVFDCSYCINRISSDVKRARFTIEELVWLTMEFYKRNYIEGLFLSSGVMKTPDHTMEEMIEVARRLRVDHKFQGYIHLKAVAGASAELLQKAGLWADRLSANIELPKQDDLDKLAPAKTHEQIESAMDSIATKIAEVKEDRKTLKSTPAFAPSGQTTQMIVGATPSSDADILATASHLYEGFSLKRVYYSAFSPIPSGDPRLPLQKPPLVRENRLYQADWLLRFYGFRHHELTTTDTPNLDLHLDPKTSWALRSRNFFPVDINRAPREDLLRVPGLGVRTVDRILKMRPHRSITLADLAKLRVSLDKARPFILTADKNTGVTLLDDQNLEAQLLPKKPKQPTLFELMGESAEGW